MAINENENANNNMEQYVLHKKEDLDYLLKEYEENYEDYAVGFYPLNEIDILSCCSKYNFTEEEKQKVEKLVNNKIESWKEEGYVLDNNDPLVSMLLEIENMAMSGIEIPQELEGYATCLASQCLDIKIGRYHDTSEMNFFGMNYETLLMAEEDVKKKNIHITSNMKACKDYIMSNINEQYKPIISKLEGKSIADADKELIEMMADSETAKISNNEDSNNFIK